MNQYIRLLLNKNDVIKSHYVGLMFTASVAIAGLFMSQSATAQHWGFSALTIAIALGIVLAIPFIRILRVHVHQASVSPNSNYCVLGLYFMACGSPFSRSQG